MNSHKKLQLCIYQGQNNFFVRFLTKQNEKEPSSGHGKRPDSQLKKLIQHFFNIFNKKNIKTLRETAC